MALDDYFESEVAVAVAATAAILSPRVRSALRQGAVYGLAGLLTAAEAAGSFARGVGRGVQQAAATAQSPDGAARKTPNTAEEAADVLTAQAQNTNGQGGAGAERRARRTRAEATGGEA